MMKSMPHTVKQKLRQYDKVMNKARELHDELAMIFEEYNVPIENLSSTDDNTEISTEALTFIEYGEGSIDENIKEIEVVFLYFVNKN